VPGRNDPRKYLPLPHRQVVLRGGLFAAAGVLGLVLAQAIFLFPFEPQPSPARSAFALVAIALFVGGTLLLILGPRLEQRFAAVHAVAAGSALLLIVLAGDGIAWLSALLAWGAAAGVSAWGASLARGIAGGAERKDQRS
jgi:hypothetical protein